MLKIRNRPRNLEVLERVKGYNFPCTAPMHLTVRTFNRLRNGESLSTGTICTSVCTSPTGGGSRPFTYVYIHMLQHRLGVNPVNHYQLSSDRLYRSLTHAISGVVAVGAYNEGGFYPISLSDKDDKNDKGSKVVHESDWQRFMETLSLLSFLSWKVVRAALCMTALTFDGGQVTMNVVSPCQ